MQLLVRVEMKIVSTKSMDKDKQVKPDKICRLLNKLALKNQEIMGEIKVNNIKQFHIILKPL